MGTTNRSVIAANIPLRLTLAEMEAPQAVVKSFLQSFDLEFCRDVLWLCLSSVMCQDDENLGTAFNRDELFAFFEGLERLIEAIFWSLKIDQNI